MSGEFRLENEELIASYSPGITLSKILDNYFEAKGGEGVMNAVTSIVTRSTQTKFGERFIVRSAKKSPEKFRYSYQKEGVEDYFFYGYNGTIAWRAVGKSIANCKILNIEKTKDLGEQAYFFSWLFKYKEKGALLTHLGVSRVNGINTYKIKAVINKNKTIYYYIDKENYQLRISLAREEIDNKIIMTKMIFSDYKFVEGLLIAHKIITNKFGFFKQTEIINQFKINSGIFDKSFEVPGRDIRLEKTIGRE